MKMNLEKSAASFSESKSDYFLLVFLLEDAISEVYFSLVLCQNENDLGRYLNSAHGAHILWRILLHPWIYCKQSHAYVLYKSKLSPKKMRCVLRGLIECKLDKQIIFSEFDAHRVFHTSDLMLS